MKKFTDITDNLIEPAIRVGSSVPSDSVNLGFYSGKEITSQNNLSYVDLSNTIPENIRSYDSFVKLMFPNEIGILEDIDGNQIIEGSGISVSNLQLSKETFDNSVEDLEEINENDFVHGYYVSRYFVMLPKYSYTLSSLEDFYDEKFLPNNIKVVDNEGKEYVDVNSGRKRYRILLEPFITSYNSIFNEIPHKIIVLLDTPNPTNINLIYDKIECLQDGSTFNQVLKYSEKINAVKYFEQVAEEAQVVDPSNSNSKEFSVKRTTATISPLLGQYSKVSGKQIFVNKKALDDNRKFENFNWRMIVEISNSVKYDNNTRYEAPIKAGVLYSENFKDLEAINPYVFFNFQQSNYNLNNYDFINPNSGSINNKSLADYWLVDIDSADLSSYDVLVFTCNWDLTAEQGRKLKNFAINNKGTLLIDASTRSGASLENIDARLSISSSAVYGATPEYSVDNLFLDSNQNNLYSINSSDFPEEYYGIFGKSIIGDNDVNPNYKQYYYFDEISTSNIIFSVENDRPLFINLRFINDNNPLTAGNIIATTTPILDYCGNTWLTNNNSVTSDLVNFSGFQNSQLIEGPFKLLANVISVCVKDRTLITDGTGTSTLYSNKSYFVSTYGGNWIMYQDILLNSEKIYFQEVISNDGERKLSKDLTPLSSNIKEFFRYSFNSNIKFQDSTITKFFDEDYSKLSFYIEYTNENVSFTNTESISDEAKASLNISNDSYVVKITDPNAKVFAYTDVESPALYIPSGIGNNLIKDKSILKTQNIFSEGNETNTTTNTAKSYLIDLATVVSIRESSELIPDKVKVTVPFTYNNAKLTQISRIRTPDTKEVRVPGTTGKINARVLSTSEEYKNTVNVDQITNSYSYTYDIDEGNTSIQYKQGSSGMDKNYIKYIQYSLNESGELPNKILVDGVFGLTTTNAVKTFQQNKLLRVSVNNGVGDGVVDSETKEALAQVWLLKTDQQIATTIFLIKDENVSKYIRAARKTRTITQALNDNVLYGENEYTNSTKVRMINFTNVKQSRDTERHVIYISLQIPTKMGNKDIDKIVSLSINDTLYPVNFSKNQGNYQGIKINNFIITDDTNIVEFISSGSKISEKKKTNYSKTKHVLTINKDLSDLTGKRILLEIEGSSIGGSFGNAEGVAIDNIVWTASTEEEVTQEEVQGSVEIIDTPVKAKISFSKTFVLYTLNDSILREIDLPSEYTIEEIELFDFSQDGVKNKTLYTDLNLQITGRGKRTVTLGQKDYRIDTTLLEHPKNPQFDIPSINGSVSFVDARDESRTVDSTYFNTSMSGKALSVTLQTEYLQSGSKILPKQIISNFRLKNKSNQILPFGINTVNYLDGALLLSKNSESLNYFPEGFDAIASIRNGYSQNSDISIANIEVINNREDEYGFVYGFYDVSKDTFLGSSISYLDYIARGPQNIYVAVYANDFDGNENDDFIGDLNSSKFPVQVSRKIVTPIYSVYSSPSNKIQLKPTLSNLSKTEPWPIRITSGSFYKYINSTEENYSSDLFYCKYDTSKIRSVAWSKIYGRGFYDVVGEKPEILSSRSIQLRQTPIHRVHEKTNLITNFGAVVRPVLRIYTRASINSPWEEISYSLIRNIDCSTGLVEFNQSVIPSFDYLIKADYTIICEELLVKTDGVGNPIPINPFLNKNDIQLNKPLYIYILPTEVYVDSNTAEQDSNNNLVPSSFVIAEDIKFDSIVNFTYDNSIFNKNDSLNYNPFALLIGVIYTINTKNDENFNLTDLRSRGGGISSSFDTNKVLSDIEEAISYWDVYPPLGEAYPKGGYIMVKIPASVKNNFVNPEDVYTIVKSNMTAGVVFEIKDMDGNDWSSS